ncbi:MAG TPA: L,D-transpeptidase family protein [Xanthobacteraceae bacterium]|nr:L,D-transpeptidase family protein [Xanthobacteraceae bacterium]
MSGIGVDRTLVSTAVALLLSISGAAWAGDPDGAKSDAAAPAAISAEPTSNAKPAASENADAAAPATAAPDQSAASAATPGPAAAAAAPSTSDTSAPEPAEAQIKPAPPPETAGTASAPQMPAAEAKPAAAPETAGAANPTPAPAAESAPASPDAAIAEQLRELGNGKFDRIVGTKKDRTQIDAFYAGRNYQPLWITDGKANDRADAAIGYLRHVDADGLDPADYAVPNFATLETPAGLANAEIALTASVITYVHHASIGRVHWSRVSADIEYDRAAPEPAEVLGAIADAKDVAAALDAYEPHTPGYLALKAKLAEIRAGKLADETAPSIGSGAVLKVGMQDDRVLQLRARLGLGGDGTTYDKALAEAVKKFQESNQIATTGTLTAATVEALNGPRPDHAEDVILANMERWRWMPHRFPDTYVVVNLPDYTLRVMHDGKQLWKTRIVIGKPEMPTPIMTADMKFITVNPTWNVPPSIVNHEYLPALEQDPTVLDRMGLKIDRNADGSIHIYQPPGDKNALGRIRFNFPNKFLVYQHDTPDKYLFANDKRAFSHGCMRVQDPVHYAEVLLSLVRPGDGYTEDRIKKMFGSGETDIQFPSFIPVDLTYQTAFVDGAGKLEFRDDVYGRDRALLAILKGPERKVADIPVEHKEDVSHREVLAMPDQPGLFGFGSRSLFGGASYYPNGYASGGYASGGNFFSRLFGGFGAASAPPRPPRQVAAHAKKVSRSGNTVER